MPSDVLLEIIDQVEVALGANSRLDGSLKFDFGDAGSVLVDGKTLPNSACDGAGRNADCVVKLSLETFESLSTGEIDILTAFILGKVQILGATVLAMRAGRLLQRGRY